MIVDFKLAIGCNRHLTVELSIANLQCTRDPAMGSKQKSNFDKNATVLIIKRFNLPLLAKNLSWF